MSQEGKAAGAPGPSGESAAGAVGAHVSDVSGGQIAVGNRVVQISAEGGSVVVAGDTQPLEVVKRQTPIKRGLRPPRLIVGRDDELQRIHSLLDQGRSLEIVGPHGVGKTTLLGALCGMPPPVTAPDGVVAPPAGLPVDDVRQFIFDACLERSQRVQPTPEEVLRYLRDLRLLVVVDDTELDRSQTERIVKSLPNSVFAIASLEPLLVSGDTPIALRGLRREDAVDLLTRAMDRPLDPAEAAAAGRLADGLEGIPLELLQLAALVTARELTLTTVVEDIAPTIEDPRAALQTATVDTLDPREKSVLTALAAFGGVAVGIGLLAKYAQERDAGTIVRRLVARGLARGDDLVGWSPVDTSAAREEDRERAAGVVVAWARDEGRRPQEVATQAPVLLAVARQDLAAGRYESVMKVAAATEGMLALAGNWGAWAAILKDGLMAARSASDRASAAFFQHQLDVRADMLAPRTLAQEHLAEAMREPDSLYRSAATDEQPTEVLPRTEVMPATGGPEPEKATRWPLVLVGGLVIAALVVAGWLLLSGAPSTAAPSVVVGPSSPLVADERGTVDITVQGPTGQGGELSVRVQDAARVRADGCEGTRDGLLVCPLGVLDETDSQPFEVSLVPRGSESVAVSADIATTAGDSDDSEIFPVGEGQNPSPTRTQSQSPTQTRTESPTQSPPPTQSPSPTQSESPNRSATPTPIPPDPPTPETADIQ